MSDNVTVRPTGDQGSRALEQASRLHEQHAAAVDRQVERARDRKAAADEQREARRAKRRE